MHRPEATKRFIIDYAIDCLKEVLTNRGVVGIHFFTLNRLVNKFYKLILLESIIKNAKKKY